MSMELPGRAPAWVGRVERRAEGPDALDLSVDPRYLAARLLVTEGGVPAGLITVGLTGGRATTSTVRAAIEEQLGPDTGERAAEEALPPSDEPLTVVIATRDRAESLRTSLAAVVAGDHPAVTVVVVDNDPPDESTRLVAEEFADRGVVYVRERRRGLSVGRNRGLREAVTRLVAFTDDDTEVDRRWASRIAAVFAAEPDLACVSGPVVGARLETEDELAAERALVWNRGFEARRYSLADPPADSAIFPFSPGLFGIGANFAVRADVARAVGGFDEALGAGAPTRGGEDCEFMVRLVLAGHQVGYDPGAFVWHHHRSSPEELRRQMRGYSMGLGAFLTKIALDPRAGAMAAKRLPAAVAQFRQIGAREATAGEGVAAGGIGERLAWIVDGGSAYVRGRRATRRAGGRVPRLSPVNSHVTSGR
ncbi:glycosyltransferase family 2 protein [Pseudonocardia lutea]|jgi:GT2 family glycosyltransferase|uniref:Glycosyltransferase family 2 protein n=1 Tax=Pseudonocardia lutea TaxID=2172015 RepID=A0ABW1IIP2_9PSEU